MVHLQHLLSLVQNSAVVRLPVMATKGTKTQFVPFVLFVVRQPFSPGRTRYRKRRNLRFAGKMTGPATKFAKSSILKNSTRVRYKTKPTGCHPNNALPAAVVAPGIRRRCVPRDDNPIPETAALVGRVFAAGVGPLAGARVDGWTERDLAHPGGVRPSRFTREIVGQPDPQLGPDRGLAERHVAQGDVAADLGGVPGRSQVSDRVAAAGVRDQPEVPSRCGRIGRRRAADRSWLLPSRPCEPASGGGLQEGDGLHYHARFLLRSTVQGRCRETTRASESSCTTGR